MPREAWPALYRHCNHCFSVWTAASEALEFPCDFTLSISSHQTELQYKPLTEVRICARPDILLSVLSGSREPATGITPSL
jgi:hypothetical protein